MPDVKIKGYSGNELEYQNVPKVYLAAPESTAENPVLVPFTYGDVVEGTEIVPDFTTGDMTVSVPEGYLVRSAVVKKPETLVPENIAKDVEIAGIVGTHKGSEGGGGGERSLDTKPIRFYDPYGSVIYGYTRKEIQELTSLPEGPTLPGLDFAGWTNGLSTLKQELYFCDVGPYYRRKSTDTLHTNYNVGVIIIETLKDNETVVFQFQGRVCSVAINWGDGTFEEITGFSTGSSLSSVTPSHKFATAGIYVVSISFAGTGACTMGYNSTSYQWNLVNRQVSTGSTAVGGAAPTASDYQIISILWGSLMNSGWYTLTLRNVHSSFRLKFVSQTTSDSTPSKRFFNCHSLKTIAGAAEASSRADMYRCANSLERVATNCTIEEGAFTGCESLKEIKVSGSTINDNNMNSKWALLLTRTTPPTISATSPKWGTYPIYVPDEAVETYKAASGWSNAADYILPASQYPD